MSREHWDLLAARMGDLRALEGIIGLLSWDQETYLPPRGGQARGEQLSTLQAILHEKLTASDLADALAKAEEDLRRSLATPDGPASHPYADLATAQAVLRRLRFDHDRASRMPAALVRALAPLQSQALVAWREARQEKRFERFAPYLEKLVALRREMADALGVPHGGERYDALLEGFEEGMRVSRLDPIFQNLAGWLVPLAERFTAAPPPPPPWGQGRFEADQQWQFARELLEAMGFELQSGRLDRSIHPFTQSTDPRDVRLTIRTDEERPLSSIFSTLHEAGHGLYEQGLPELHRRHVLCAAPSMGLHESQSRLWENLVGRSLPFWRHFYPRLQSRFPALSAAPLESFYRYVNRVERSLIRIDADEVTYNLHIALRFGLELALVRGDLAVKDLPGAWNERSHALLGVRPNHDAEGVLQDIHWAWGEFGYFPTYTLGNLYSASLYEAARRELPELEPLLAAGKLLPLRDWLRRRVHQQGRALHAEELVCQVTGRGLTDLDFRTYLESKYAQS